MLTDCQRTATCRRRHAPPPLRPSFAVGHELEDRDETEVGSLTVMDLVKPAVRNGLLERHVDDIGLEAGIDPLLRKRRLNPTFHVRLDGELFDPLKLISTQ